MTLIIIIAAILIERFWQGIRDHRQKNYFGQGLQLLLSSLPDTVKSNLWLCVFVLLVVPFIIVYLLHLIMLNMFGGLLALLFDVALLLLCVSSKPDDEKINQFIIAQQDNDKAGMSDAFYELTGVYIETVNRPNSFVMRSLLLQNCRRWFGVIFYFIFLGPAGVVMYRSLQDFVVSDETVDLQETLSKLLAYIEWPLSRLLALTFFLSGSFDDALKGWKDRQGYLDCGDQLIQGNEIQQGNQLVILSTGCAAISHDIQDEAHNDTAYVQAAQGMLSRSLIIWCAVIAILTLTDVFT